MVIVAVIFVGARQIHSGGIWGIIGDSVTEASTDPDTAPVRARMLKGIFPVTAAAICFDQYGEMAGLKDAVVGFNTRHEDAMQRDVAAIEALGGMSNNEKDMLKRQAYVRAEDLLGQGAEVERACSSLIARLNSGEFDFN